MLSVSRSITVPRKRAASRAVTGLGHVRKTHTIKCTVTGRYSLPQTVHSPRDLLQSEERPR